MWGRCSASRAKPFGKTLRRRSLVAVACWIIVASGFSRMSMAVIAFGLVSAAKAFPPVRATTQAIAPLSRMFLTFVFMAVSFLVISLSDQLDEFSNAKIFFQSFFMLMMVQPSFCALS